MEPKNDEQRSSANSEPTVNSGTTDVVLIHGRSADGKGLSVIRHRNDQLERGVVVPLEHGKPIHGEVVTLRPRPEFPLLCDVHVECTGRTADAENTDTRAVGKGPRQVATEQYRANWEKIFERSPTPKGNLN
jgi:hypothetical protein